MGFNGVKTQSYQSNTTIWKIYGGFQKDKKIVVSINEGYPKFAGWFNGKSKSKMHDLGVLFQETSISINFHRFMVDFPRR